MTVEVNCFRKAKFDHWDKWTFSLTQIDQTEQEIEEFDDTMLKIEHLAKARGVIEFARNKRTRTMSFFVKSDIRDHVERYLRESWLNMSLAEHN